MADNTTVEESMGYTKEETLSNATAELFGLGTDAVPDDAFTEILDIVNWYVWETLSSSWDTTENSYYSRSGTSYRTIFASDKVSVTTSGIFNLVDYTKWSISDRTNAEDILNFIKGKYFFVKDSSDSDNNVYSTLYFGQSNTTCNQNLYYGILKFSNVTKLTNALVFPQGYTLTHDNVPPSVEGFTYIPRGLLGEKTRISTGSYVGTGTYGESNPNSLTFGFEPKLVIIGLRGIYINHYFWGESSMCGANSYSSDLVVTVNDTTMNWYHSSDVSGQLNSTNTYHYIAIS